ncbi:MAG: hypothetical protein ACKV2Q_15235 [Planctomycetaceae bacterium]
MTLGIGRYAPDPHSRAIHRHDCNDRCDTLEPHDRHSPQSSPTTASPDSEIRATGSSHGSDGLLLKSPPMASPCRSTQELRTVIPISTERWDKQLVQLQ